ncbi:efflux RND transporter periplasmic adaptor subunit [Marinobacter subterrani]|uniref:RND family efflux transporter, MFP subunit n=1 Tax=Marinobacter subterrani TaxID=1658765 RepID=A0A0J7JDN7_9GAMM|nr:HlyD family secretion protein [Marinobacter subterrani]KMQ75994.1 RND family efflux transporter, MFP subunit [Marinobacter subterrani]
MVKLLRVGTTLLVVAVAIAAGTWVWNHYLYSPWTRDGRIQADVITIAPDVSGWVTDLAVRNHQTVKQGEVLFHIDNTRYKAAVTEAKARVDQKRIAWELAKHKYKRRQQLSGRRAISEEDLETYRIKSESAKAAYNLAQAQLYTAQIDLGRTEVVAPESGTISNLSLREGNYVTRGNPVISLIKSGSFSVTGYFEETKLQRVHPGQEARIRLMGGGETLTGTVTSIARGIANSNTSSNNQLLPQVQQAFNWVRLAQRIPVDIALDPVPDDVNISAGMTVSIYLGDDQ